MIDSITVEVFIDAGMEKVWQYFTDTEHIKNWYFASDKWHCPDAANDFVVDGKFLIRMEAKGGTLGFDFKGTNKEIIEFEEIKYILDDGRRVKVEFKHVGDKIHVVETFEPETQNDRKLQKEGWQNILNNFKKYVESLN